MKNILIPSDFTVQSLNYLASLLPQVASERLNILLVHAFAMPDSLVDLMLLSRRNEENEYVSAEFQKHCQQWEKAHRDRIHSIRVKCFYGSTKALFKNFLEGHRIDLIAYPKQYPYKNLCKTSVDLTKLIEKSERKVILLTEERPQQECSSLPRVKNISYSFSLN